MHARGMLHAICILDCSSGMAVDGKIHALNTAIRESIPHFQLAADENPAAEILMSAVTYGTGARWHLEPTSPVKLKWPDVSAYGRADAGAAFQLVEGRLWRWMDIDTRSWFPPLLIWVASAGLTDSWEYPLDILVAASKIFGSIRIAVPLGEEAPLQPLQRFGKPSQPNSLETLTKHLRFVEIAMTTEEQCSLRSGLTNLIVQQNNLLIDSADE